MGSTSGVYTSRCLLETTFAATQSPLVNDCGRPRATLTREAGMISETDLFLVTTSRRSFVSLRLSVAGVALCAGYRFATSSMRSLYLEPWKRSRSFTVNHELRHGCYFTSLSPLCTPPPHAAVPSVSFFFFSNTPNALCLGRVTVCLTARTSSPFGIAQPPTLRASKRYGRP